jgi:hypothetical protein
MTLTNDGPVFSSETAPHKDKTVHESQTGLYTNTD